MSILSALKAKGAKGNNIEEAVKSMDFGGSGGGAYPYYQIVSNSGVYSLDGITRTELETLVKSEYNPIYFYYRENGNACYTGSGGYGVTRGTMGEVTGIVVTMFGPANPTGGSSSPSLNVKCATIPFKDSHDITVVSKNVYLG